MEIPFLGQPTRNWFSKCYVLLLSRGIADFAGAHSRSGTAPSYALQFTLTLAFCSSDNLQVSGLVFPFLGLSCIDMDSAYVVLSMGCVGEHNMLLELGVCL